MSRSCECGERTFGNSDDSERFDSGSIHSAARCVGMGDEIAALRAENARLRSRVEVLEGALQEISTLEASSPGGVVEAYYAIKRTARRVLGGGGGK